MLKVKIIRSNDDEKFEFELEKFLNTIGPGSVQYRAVVNNGYLQHTACVIHEVQVEGE
jgi:hypothetical protein